VKDAVFQWYVSVAGVLVSADAASGAVVQDLPEVAEDMISRGA
jgi:hypothetical protein